MRKIVFALVVALGLVQHAVADTYPAKPITIIVPYGPGGGTDQFARALASKLGPKLGQSVIVDNAPGAGGIIGIQELNNAPADGYTLLIASGMEYEMQALSNNDAGGRSTELKPIGNFGTQPMVLVARPGLGIKTVDALIERARAKPGTISIATVGPGTALSMTTLMLQQAAGIKLIDVPYKGAGQIVTDILSGSVDIALMSPPTVVGMIQQGKLVALAISEATRSPVVPGVPSLAETPALKGIDTKIGYPLYGPKALPQPIADLIAKRSNEVLADPQFQESLMHLLIAPAKRVAGEDAESLKASQLAQFRKALAGTSK